MIMLNFSKVAICAREKERKMFVMFMFGCAPQCPEVYATVTLNGYESEKYITNPVTGECSFCATDVPQDANRCPNCRRTTITRKVEIHLTTLKANWFGGWNRTWLSPDKLEKQFQKDKTDFPWISIAQCRGLGRLTNLLSGTYSDMCPECEGGRKRRGETQKVVYDVWKNVKGKRTPLPDGLDVRKYTDEEVLRKRREHAEALRRQKDYLDPEVIFVGKPNKIAPAANPAPAPAQRPDTPSNGSASGSTGGSAWSMSIGTPVQNADGTTSWIVD